MTARAFIAAAPWMSAAACRGRRALFFPPPGEQPDVRERREYEARAVCSVCPVVGPCRTWAREHREYGFWGGESEEERAAAGYRVDMPVGRVARYPRGQGKPISPRVARVAQKIQEVAKAGLEPKPCR